MAQRKFGYMSAGRNFGECFNVKMFKVKWCQGFHCLAQVGKGLSARVLLPHAGAAKATTQRGQLLTSKLSNTMNLN
jgi:hypothetical protein